MANPYLIQGPALISFSGGRSSGYMLHQIIQAHGGSLPDDIHVVFANTGKEREETLRFVHECASRWGVRITWIEWTGGSSGDSPVTFEEVGFNSASRDGEPFQRLIAKKQRVPNGRERWCTGFLKVKIIMALAASRGLIKGQHPEVIGLRDDEGWRILKGLADAKETGRHVLYPMAKAKVTKAEVLAFWLGPSMQMANGDRPQGFDLGLEPWEGNCDLCFLKGRAIRRRILRDRPGSSRWWSGQEMAVGGTFDKETSVADLAAQVHAAPMLFEEADAEEEFDAECGLLCAAD